MQVDVEIFAYEGDDVIEILDAISVDANLGPGDDRYYGSFYVGPEWSGNVWGGPADGILEGRAAEDHLSGGPGNDSIRGHSGVDFRLGGGDVDTLHGGNGDDQLEGGAGTDTLFGDAGKDALWGNKRPPYDSLGACLIRPTTRLTNCLEGMVAMNFMLRITPMKFYLLVPSRLLLKSKWNRM